MVLRIFKMIATSGFLTALECNKFVFGRGSVPDATGGAHSAPPDPLAGLRGTTSKGNGERVRKERKTGEGKRKRRGGTAPPTFANPWIRPCIVYETVGLMKSWDKLTVVDVFRFLLCRVIFFLLSDRFCCSYIL